MTVSIPSWYKPNPHTDRADWLTIDDRINLQRCAHERALNALRDKQPCLPDVTSVRLWAASLAYYLDYTR